MVLSKDLVKTIVKGSKIVLEIGKETGSAQQVWAKGKKHTLQSEGGPPGKREHAAKP